MLFQADRSAIAGFQIASSFSGWIFAFTTNIAHLLLSTGIPRKAYFSVLYYSLKFSFHLSLETVQYQVFLFFYFFLFQSFGPWQIWKMVFVFICHLSIVPPLMNYSFIILLYIAACCVCFGTCRKQKPCFYVSLVERSLCKQTSPKAAYCTTVKMSNNHVLYYMFSGLVFFSSEEYFCLLASMIWRDDCLNKGKFAYKIRWMWYK